MDAFLDIIFFTFPIVYNYFWSEWWSTPILNAIEKKCVIFIKICSHGGAAGLSALQDTHLTLQLVVT
jgi:hypothetical protein